LRHNPIRTLALITSLHHVLDFCSRPTTHLDATLILPHLRYAIRCLLYTALSPLLVLFIIFHLDIRDVTSSGRTCHGIFDSLIPARAFPLPVPPAASVAARCIEAVLLIKLFATVVNGTRSPLLRMRRVQLVRIPSVTLRPRRIFP